MRHLFFHAFGGRARARAVHEAEGLVEPDVLDQRQRFREFLVGLAGKTHDEIGSHADAGPGAPQAGDLVPILVRRIAALHAGQHAVRAALHRQVQVGRQLVEAGVGVDQPAVEFHGVGGREADPAESLEFRHVADQPGEVLESARRRDSAIAVDVLAQQVDFAHALALQLDRLGQHVRDRPGDLLAARVRHDAKRAVLAAALHDRQMGHGRRGLRRRQLFEFFLGGERDIHDRSGSVGRLPKQAGKPVQRLRAEYDVHVGRALAYGLSFLASNAAAHADLHFRPLALERLVAAEFGEQFFLGFLAHRAGVDQHEVGLLGLVGERVAAALTQNVRHPRGVVLVHLAPEGPYEKFAAHQPSAFDHEGRGGLRRGPRRP